MFQTTGHRVQNITAHRIAIATGVIADTHGLLREAVDEQSCAMAGHYLAISSDIWSCDERRTSLM